MRRKLESALKRPVELADSARSGRSRTAPFC